MTKYNALNINLRYMYTSGKYQLFSIIFNSKSFDSALCHERSHNHFVMMLCGSCSALSLIITAGPNSDTMKVHLLRHITSCVRDWGPLWAYSALQFEGMNHIIKKLFHSSKNTSKEVG